MGTYEIYSHRPAVELEEILPYSLMYWSEISSYFKFRFDFTSLEIDKAIIINHSWIRDSTPLRIKVGNI